LQILAAPGRRGSNNEEYQGVDDFSQRVPRVASDRDDSNP